MAAIDPTMLRNIELFALLDDEESATLAAQLEQRQVWAGQTVFKAGDPGGHMFVVQSGRVELFIVDRNSEYVSLGFIGQGELFGELSLFDSEPRSATAKAVQDTSLFVIDRHDLEVLFKSHPPSIFDVMTTLGKRIREADVLVGERVVARNANEVVMMKRTISQRLADLFSAVAGDMRFVYFSAVWFIIWIVWNLGLLPGVEPFDPYPFGLLTMIVSLEAIFLSTFVLVSQNRSAEREKVRNDIEYEVNIQAEREIKELHHKLDELQDMMLGHLQRIDSNVKLQTQTGTSHTIERSIKGQV